MAKNFLLMKISSYNNNNYYGSKQCRMEINLINRDYPSYYSSYGVGSDESGTREGGGSWRRRKRLRETFDDDFIESRFRKRRKVVNMQLLHASTKNLEIFVVKIFS